jgi:hypothetical protein
MSAECAVAERASAGHQVNDCNEAFARSALTESNINFSSEVRTTLCDGSVIEEEEVGIDAVEELSVEIGEFSTEFEVVGTPSDLEPPALKKKRDEPATMTEIRMNGIPFLALACPGQFDCPHTSHVGAKGSSRSHGLTISSLRGRMQ